MPPATTQPSAETRLVKALAHPVRQRLLAILNERVASPKELAAELEMPIPNVSYHVRALAQLECIELVRTEPRRGAMEHFYRALVRPWFDDDQWAKVPVSTRRAVFDENLRNIFTDVRAAAKHNGFDDVHTHVSRTPVVLDDKGYEQVTDLLARTLDRIIDIQAKSAGRLARSGVEGRTTEVVMLHFDKAPPESAAPTAKRRAPRKT